VSDELGLVERLPYRCSAWCVVFGFWGRRVSSPAASMFPSSWLAALRRQAHRCTSRRISQGRLVILSDSQIKSLKTRSSARRGIPIRQCFVSYGQYEIAVSREPADAASYDDVDGQRTAPQRRAYVESRQGQEAAAAQKYNGSTAQAAIPQATVIAFAARRCGRVCIPVCNGPKVSSLRRTAWTS
jgi:hypothetical protein